MITSDVLRFLNTLTHIRQLRRLVGCTEQTLLYKRLSANAVIPLQQTSGKFSLHVKITIKYARSRITSHFSYKIQTVLPDSLKTLFSCCYSYKPGFFSGRMAQNMQPAICIFNSKIPYIAFIIRYCDIEPMVFIINFINQVLEHCRA